MKRLIIVCEGQTEQAFCKTILQPYLLSRQIIINAPIIKHTMGGIVRWQILKKQIETHLVVEKDAYVTTLIDYYGLYSKYEFPEWTRCESIVDRAARMSALELAMHNDVDEKFRYRYIPYLQLHEFEALLFNDINIFYTHIPTSDLVGVEELQRTFNQYENPEMINNVRATSPSHRLMRIIRGYHKVVYGEILAEVIGLENIRAKSPRFNEWIKKIESI